MFENCIKYDAFCLIFQLSASLNKTFASFSHFPGSSNIVTGETKSFFSFAKSVSIVKVHGQ